MGKLGKYLRDNGKEHGCCTDHNLHLVAKLAFEQNKVIKLVAMYLFTSNPIEAIKITPPKRIVPSTIVVGRVSMP